MSSLLPSDTCFDVLRIVNGLLFVLTPAVATISIGLLLYLPNGTPIGSRRLHIGLIACGALHSTCIAGVGSTVDPANGLVTLGGLLASIPIPHKIWVLIYASTLTINTTLVGCTAIKIAASIDEKSPARFLAKPIPFILFCETIIVAAFSASTIVVSTFFIPQTVFSKSVYTMIPVCIALAILVYGKILWFTASYSLHSTLRRGRNKSLGTEELWKLLVFYAFAYVFLLFLPCAVALVSYIASPDGRLPTPCRLFVILMLTTHGIIISILYPIVVVKIRVIILKTIRIPTSTAIGR